MGSYVNIAHVMPYFVGLVGLMIGSFLNVCIYRIPEGTFWKRSRSHCRQCDAMIPFYSNIPVLSFLVLGGKCAHCRTKISWQYPVVEILTATLLVVFYLKYPFWVTLSSGTGQALGSSGAIFVAEDFLRFMHASVFICFLMIATFVDLRLMIIPDVISLGLVVLTPLVVYLHPELRWQNALIGVIVGGGSLYLVAWIYWIVRKQIGMGMGDVKLLAGIGGWLGYESIGAVIIYAAMAGSVVGLAMVGMFRRGHLKMALPFGPFLAGAAILYLWTGPELLAWLHFGHWN